MTVEQQIVTIGIMAVAVMFTRFVSFVAFPSRERTPEFIHYLSRYLPSAVFGMLVIYCVRNVDVTGGSHGIPEAAGILACVLLHLWKKNMLLTIAGGTVFYMVLVQTVF